MIENNEDYDICSKCGGECCRHLPGPMFPQDFDKDLNRNKIKNNLLKAINSGLYSIDYWEGDPLQSDDNEPGNDDLDTISWGRAYYIRPRIRGNDIIDPAWYGECIFLTSTGCALDWEQRPSGCRAVVPEKNHECDLQGNYGKQDSAVAWLKFNDIIRKIESTVRAACGEK